MTWSTQHTESSAASRDAIWDRWRDVEHWSSWDSGVEWANLSGPFQAGASGKLKPTGARVFAFEVTDAHPGRSFADETKLPLGRLRFEHELTDDPAGGTRITHRAIISGPLTPLWARIIGRDIERHLPPSVRKLADQASG